jgi:hypothetical protein
MWSFYDYNNVLWSRRGRLRWRSLPHSYAQRKGAVGCSVWKWRGDHWAGKVGDDCHVGGIRRGQGSLSARCDILLICCKQAHVIFTSILIILNTKWSIYPMFCVCLLSFSLQEKRDREIELQKVFNRRVFDTFYNMKDAFQNVSFIFQISYCVMIC